MMQDEMWMNQVANVIPVLMPLDVDCFYRHLFVVAVDGIVQVVVVDCNDDDDDFDGYRVMSVW